MQISTESRENVLEIFSFYPFRYIPIQCTSKYVCTKLVVRLITTAMYHLRLKKHTSPSEILIRYVSENKKMQAQGLKAITLPFGLMEHGTLSSSSLRKTKSASNTFLIIFF